jgi:molybdopterin-binding protein
MTCRVVAAEKSWSGSWRAQVQHGTNRSPTIGRASTSAGEVARFSAGSACKIFHDAEFDMLSARNQFPGTVKAVTLGNVMAEVVIAVKGIEFVSAITRGSAESLNLKVGDAVTVIIKSTEVLVGKD